MDLHVEMQGEEIVVTKPGTDFLLAYRKRRPESRSHAKLGKAYRHVTRD
jgi:hypothetical protein